MKGINLSKKYFLIIGAILLLIVPAFFINLTELTLIPDESIRALVALEMTISGDYITPTMGAEYYCKKPPIFNWIIASFYTITGNYTELATRIPMVISLFGYALTIFLVTKKRYGIRTGFLAAILFVVTIRILIYESLFGLIDLTYSWILFFNVILIYRLFHEKKLLKLFLFSYALAAIAFLFKGLTAIPFQGFTLFIIFIANKQFKSLISWKHVLGILTFCVILGAYYLAYHIKNPGRLDKLLLILFHESSDKSAIAFGIWDIIKHFFSFSGEMLLAFLPSTLLVIFFFKKQPFSELKKDPFLNYLILVFIINSSIFLVSPISYMRYLLPMSSNLSIALAVYYFIHKSETGSVHIKIIDTLILSASIIICIGLLAFPLIPQLQFVEYRWLKASFLSVMLFGTLIWLWKKTQYRLELLIISLLILRIGFNLFIIPSRIHNHWQASMREKSLEIGEKLRGKEVNLHHTIVTTTHYYLTAGKQEIIPYNREQDSIPNGYSFVLANSNKYEDRPVIFSHKVAGANLILEVIKW